MGLSKSVFIEAIQCKKRGWLSKHKSKEEKVSNKSEELMQSGHEIGDAAKRIFGDYVEVSYSPIKKDMIQETQMLILNGVKVIAEATFAAAGCYCQADILVQNDDNTISVYEVKGSTKIKPYHLDDMAFQYYVISQDGYNIKNFSHIHINSDYIRDEELDLNELFVIEDCTAQILEKQDGLKEKIDEVKKALRASEEPDICIGVKCKDPTECPYFEYCTRNIPKNNVFEVANMGYKKKFELYDRGIVTFADILDKQPKLTDKQYEQITATEYDKPVSYDRAEIKRFLSKFGEPLYFLDFETYQQAVPQYPEVSPFSQIPFQYSLHYIEEPGGKLKHKECLGTPPEDPRYLIARRLCEDIPMNVTTLAYNMAFERMVIKGLAELFPEFYIHLMNIRENMQDLMVPFKNRWYYDKNFKGSYSIKVVLPVLFPDDPSLDYHNLDEEVQNGSMAMAAYASMAQMTDAEKISKIRQCLLEYCKLDTFAMVKIWQYLKSIC